VFLVPVLTACENVNYPLVMMQSDHREELVGRGAHVPSPQRA
jgi:hypothetical protein